MSGNGFIPVAPGRKAPAVGQAPNAARSREDEILDELYEMAVADGFDEEMERAERVREREEFEALWRETLEEVRRMSVEEWKEAMESAGESVEDDVDDVPKSVVDRAVQLFVARYHYWRL